MAIARAARLFRFGLVAGLAVLALLFKHCQAPPEKEQVQASAIKTAATTPVTEADYVGSAACQSCHAEAFADWLGSHHDQAMEPANDTTVLGDFGNVTFASRGVRTRFYREGEKFMVNTEGPDGTYQDFEISHTFGVYPLQQYLAVFPKGRLQALRVAWDSEKDRWYDLYPDMDIEPQEWLHWTGGAMNWNSSCADCHSTHLRKHYDAAADSFHTTYALMDVSCEACHGAGKKHIELVSAPDYVEKKGKADHQLHLLPGIPSTEQVDQCARCHSRRSQFSEAFVPGEKFLDHYLPELLVDGTYFADGQILDEDYVYGSFVQSRMYHEGVKCTDCHNPHSTQLRYEGNRLCMQCHEPKYDEPGHHFHPQGSESAQCINCHMTGRTYMGNDFRRDHSFRIPRPDQSVAFGTPNACNGCHETQDAQWAADQVEAWYGPERKPHFSDALTLGRERTARSMVPLQRLIEASDEPGIARATAVQYLVETAGAEALPVLQRALNDSTALVRHAAVQALSQWPATERLSLLGPRLRDSLRVVRVAAADALADVPAQHWNAAARSDFERARQELRASMQAQADYRGGQFMIGQYHDRLGQPAEAEQAYQRAIAMDSRFNAARMNLAVLYNRLGRNEEAERLLRKVVEQEPEYGPAYYSLGLLLAESPERLEEAAEVLGQAATRVGINSRIFYNWGLALQHLERSADAERAYQAGLEVEPASAVLNNALAILHLQAGRPERALPHAQLLVEQYPQQQEFRQLLQQVQMRLQGGAGQ